MRLALQRWQAPGYAGLRRRRRRLVLGQRRPGCRAPFHQPPTECRRGVREAQFSRLPPPAPSVAGPNRHPCCAFNCGFELMKPADQARLIDKADRSERLGRDAKAGSNSGSGEIGASGEQWSQLPCRCSTLFSQRVSLKEQRYEVETRLRCRDDVFRTGFAPLPVCCGAGPMGTLGASYKRRMPVG